MATKETYGCIMLFLDPYDIQDVKINEEDLYFTDNSDEYWISGRETEPHITVLYGLHNDIEHDEVCAFIKEMEVSKITFDSIEIFEPSDDYDVIVYKVSGKTLHDNNKSLRDQFPYTTDFPDYKPHCTIAYVKKGCGNKYLKDFKSFDVKPIKWVYSLKDDGEYNIQIFSKDVVEQLRSMKKLY